MRHYSRVIYIRVEDNTPLVLEKWPVRRLDWQHYANGCVLHGVGNGSDRNIRACLFAISDSNMQVLIALCKF